MLNVKLCRVDKIMGTRCNSIKSMRSLKISQLQQEVISLCLHFKKNDQAQCPSIKLTLVLIFVLKHGRCVNRAKLTPL